MTAVLDSWFNRPTSPNLCGWCGTKIKHGRETCGPCRSMQAKTERGYNDDDALTGGAWVNDRGVMRWEPSHVA